MRKTRTLVVIGIALGGAIYCNNALAMGGPTDKELLDAEVLRSAPWLTCTSGPDEAAGLPDLLFWDWHKRQFTPKQLNPDSIDEYHSVVILFDDAKTRAREVLFRNVGGVLSPVAEPEPKDIPVFLVDYMIAIQSGDPFRPSGFVRNTVMISYVRAADGRFTGLQQGFGSIELFGESGAYSIPAACATTAEEPLKQAIEAARAKWLAGEPVVIPPPPPVVAPPAPPPAPEATQPSGEEGKSN